MRSFAPITRAYEAAVIASAPDEVLRKKSLRLSESICELYALWPTTEAMPRILAFLLLPVLGGMLSLPGAAAAPPKTAPVSSHSVSDSQLEATIHAKLAKSKIVKDGFRFHVQRGVVTWEGTTAVPQHKGAATRMARTAGAVQVVNNIKVTGTTSAPMRKAYVQP